MRASNYFHEIGHEPTASFGVERATDGEVVGPIRPDSVDYGHWTWNFNGVFPMVVMHFNKYHPLLPPWESTVEMFLASETGFALANVASHLDTKISGNLKSVSLGVHGVSPEECEGDIISCEDVSDGPHNSSQKPFTVTDVLE